VNSFGVKGLRARFILDDAGVVFPGTNSNTLIVTGLRMSAQIQASALQQSQMALKVWGMKREDMDAITVAWANPPVVLNHRVILEANNGDGWSKVFGGTIIEAQPDYRSAPDTAFSSLASVGYFQKIEPVASTPYTETTDISAVAGDLADKMGFTFVDGGAQAVLQGPVYLFGTLLDQLDQACRMAGCDYYLTGSDSEPTGAPRAGAVNPQDAQGTLTITPRGQPIEGAQVAALLRDSTGLIGYPVYERSGLSVQALWQPAFGCGVPIQIESIVPSATGLWYPYSMVHQLDSNLPNGKWFTDMKCNRRLV
jgi:hypothetical protein